MQTAIGSFLEQELAEVAGWNEVIGLGLELFVSILAPLSSVALDGALLLVGPYRATIAPVDPTGGAYNALLVLVRLFVDLTAVNILVLWVWLLQVAWVRLVLVVLGRG